MYNITCSTDGCDETAHGWDGQCSFHAALAAARRLPPESWDRLRSTLADTSPLTDEERRASRIRATLRTLEWTSRDYKRAIDAAKDAGATDEQIRTALDAFPTEPARDMAKLVEDIAGLKEAVTVADQVNAAAVEAAKRGKR